MFLDVIIETSKKELTEECDYLSESAKQIKMRELVMNTAELKDHVYIPRIIEDLTTDSVITSEFIKGWSFDYVA